MRRRTLLGALPLLLSTAESLAHPPRQPDAAEAKRLIQEVTDFRVFTGPTVIVAGRSPIPNTTERKTDEVRWVSVYVTAQE